MEAMGQSRLTLFLLFSICLLLPCTLAIPVKYCDKKGDYDVKVHGVEILPYPVETGKPATFKVSASTGQAISDGKVVIDVSYYTVHVHQETHDLCEELSCPVTLGEFVLSHTQTLPGFTPPGSYTLRMRMVDKNDHQLTCFTFNFKIGFGSSVSDI